jgi:ABC-type nitrate/sulfonate/bicarbonate transport system permease component
VAVLLALLLLWELASRAGWVPVRFFPPVSEILATFFRTVAEGVLAAHLGMTLARMTAGGIIALAVGIGLGLAMGYRESLYRTFRPLAEFLRPMPPVAIIPALILLLGIGDEMKVAVIAFGCIWPILLNTVDGVRGVHPILLEVARNFRFSHGETLRKIILPAALPQIMAGLRVSLAIAFILSLVSEMVGSTNGLGFFILFAQRSFRVREMYAGIVLLAITGYALNAGFLRVEGRILAWHRASAGLIAE